MADLTFQGDYTFEETPQFKTLISTFENGVEQRRNKWSSGIKEFKIVAKNRPLTDFETIRDFFVAKKGAYTSFTWVNPNDNVEYTVRFKEDSLRFTLLSYQRYDFEFSLIEVK